MDQAVTQARMGSGKHAGSFVNAVLRKAFESAPCWTRLLEKTRIV